MFAEDDQWSAGNGLEVIQFLKEGVGGRATGTAFRGEEFYENGMRIRSLGLNCRGLNACDFVFDLYTPPVRWG